MNVDVKQYSTFGPRAATLAQYSSALGLLKGKGAALAGFNLSYGEENKHFVEAITVQAGDPSNAGDNQFTFPTEATMNDSSKHTAVAAASFLAPAVFAPGASAATLEIQTGLVSSGNGHDFNFTRTLAGAHVALGGFAVSYGRGTDHKVLSLKASAAITNPDKINRMVTVAGGASIKDKQPNEGKGPVQVLVFGQVAGDPTKFMTTTWRTGSGEATVTLSGLSSPITQAAVFIQGFDLDYGNNQDQDVRSILLDAGNNSLDIANSGSGTAQTAVISFTPQLVMTDGAKVASGSLSLLVMAMSAPAPAA